MSNLPAGKIVWADPIRSLVGELRRDAATLREIGKDPDRAALLDAVAMRLEERLLHAAHGEWVRTADVATIRGIEEDSVRAWCRRALRPQGLAKKIGGHWHVHVDALVGEDARKAAAA